MRNFTKNHECFEVLYNASVGVERLQNISIILAEHTDSLNQEKFENQLITHDRIAAVSPTKRIEKAMKKLSFRLSITVIPFLQSQKSQNVDVQHSTMDHHMQYFCIVRIIT